MPRAGAGSGSGRSSSGHDGGSRMSSGHRPSMPGSGRRAGGGGSAGFPQSSGSTGSGGFDVGDLFRAAGIGMAGGYNAGRRSTRNRYGRRSMPFPEEIFDAMGQQPNYGRQQTPFGGNNNGGKKPNGGLTGLMPLIGILAALVIFLLIFMMPSCSNNEPNRNDYNVTVPESTYNRTKLDSGLPYDSNCIDDQLGWFENRTSAAKRLKVFYDKTGIQPYILFAKYNPQLKTDDEKQAWAREWYDDHIDNEDTLLFVYFAEQDVDNDVGYMTLVNGKHVSSIMDAQATEIFWTYLDEYWYSDRSTDDAIVATFDSTADRIMTKTTTKNDVHKWVIIAVIVIGILAIGAVITWMLIKRKREHEQYVERMVTTPLEEARDPILEKYDQADHNDQVGQEQKGQ
ncbi:PE-PGRS family protein [Bifidobacterium animalis subsp. lactis]|nr:hypothetical protein [Bifidobacterium animalis]RYM91649.1 PE-PGRS family protein [Bifidobacterium animalis subsp. lactis]RYM91846.1 PE-PGRS family protein [Bifidobacterium animalis subsp. lactis]